MGLELRLGERTPRTISRHHLSEIALPSSLRYSLSQTIDDVVQYMSRQGRGCKKRYVFA